MTPTQVESTFSELWQVARQGRHVWAFLARSQRWRLLGAVALMAILGWCSAAIPLTLGRLVDGVLTGDIKSLAAAWMPLTILAALYLLREVIQVARKVVVEATCTSVEKAATMQLLARLFRAEIGTLAVDRVGALHGRIHRSVEGLVRYLKLGFLDFFPAIFVAIFSVAAALLRRFDLGLLMTAVLPVGGYIVLRQLASQKGIRLELLRTKEAMDATVVEQLGGIEYVRAANTHGLELARVETIAESLRQKELRHHVAMTLYDSAKALNEGLVHVVVIMGALTLALNGVITSGDVLTFSVLFMSVLAPLREVHRILDEAHESSLRVADLLGMLADPLDRSFGDGSTEEPAVERSAPIIEVSDLHVEYRGEKEAVLRGVSFSIGAGEVIGLAGPSGSGKSTLVRALLRLVHPAGGSLFVGGVPIHAVSRDSIGRLFGFVGQTPFVFAGTVAENIAYGCPGATPADVRRSARFARLDDDILSMPGGYDALIAERGQNLSGGQRQRLALARIFLKDPPILILDEATSALDNLNERAVLEALTTAASGRTILMVAHRLSTLRNADRILVFEAGRLVESGTYAQLVDAEGLFAQLLRASSDVASPRQPRGATSGADDSPPMSSPA
jgi:ATP-binding cassette subfamily B protein